MKGLWLGCGILLILLGLVLGVQRGMERIYTPMENMLSQAGEAALAGDWDTAGELAEKAQQRWDTYRSMTAAVADHDPMDELDMLFEQLPAYCREQETADFAAACAAAAYMAQAMGEAQKLTWWNFF